MIIKQPLPRTGSTSSDRATVVAWHVDVGSSVTVGQAVADVETDKSVVSVESTVAGVVAELSVPLNDEIEIGQTLLLVDDGTAGESAPVADADAVADRAEAKASAATQPPAQAPRSNDSQSGTGVRATPAARHRARELGIDLAKLAPGSGPLGRIEASDVKPASHAAQPAWANNLKGTRRTIALRMAAAAAQVVPVTLFRDADVTALVGRDDGNVLDALLAVIAQKLAQHPAVNAHLDERGLTEHRHVHLAYAVDGARGLIAPVIRDAHRMTLAELAGSRRALVQQALAGTLPTDAADGATFTVSNLGSLGIGRFTPIVSPPQIAILGLGAVEETFKLRADGSVASVRTLPLSLTFDHRAVDGAPAARFLADVVAGCADPQRAGIGAPGRS